MYVCRICTAAWTLGWRMALVFDADDKLKAATDEGVPPVRAARSLGPIAKHLSNTTRTTNMTANSPIEVGVEVKPERLVPLDTWVDENARKLSIWKHGSPFLIAPQGMGKWVKRHEAGLAKRVAVIRVGNAWRIVEPAFKPVLIEILTEERNWKNQRKASRK